MKRQSMKKHWVRIDKPADIYNALAEMAKGIDQDKNKKFANHIMRIKLKLQNENEPITLSLTEHQISTINIGIEKYDPRLKKIKY